MIPIPPRIDKRTVLGGQCLLIATLSALPSESAPFTVPLAAVGAYLAFGRKPRPNATTSSKLLLRAK